MRKGLYDYDLDDDDDEQMLSNYCRMHKDFS